MAVESSTGRHLVIQKAFAQLVAAQTREQVLTTSHDRLRELAAVLAKREAAGDAAGFDRLRAEREVLDIEADHALAASERARAQATVASSFADTIDPSRVVAVPRQPTPASIPTVDALVERAEAARGDLLALRKEVDAAQFSAKAADRRWVPEPEIVAERSRRPQAAAILEASLPFTGTFRSSIEANPNGRLRSRVRVRRRRASTRFASRCAAISPHCERRFWNGVTLPTDTAPPR